MADVPKTDVEAAVRFLEWKRPGGPWALIAPTPDWDKGSPLTWLRTTDELRRYVADRSGKFVVYYPVAEVAPELLQQPKKEHLVESRLLHVDLDPPSDVPPAAFDEWARAKVEEVRAQTHSPPPSCIVMSGNGLHLLWALAEPHHLGGAEVIIADFEAYTNCLALAFGAVDGTWNANRVLRLPGTINLPNAKKRKGGRTARESSIVELHHSRVYTLADFHAVPVGDNDRAPRKTAGGPAALPEREQVRCLSAPTELDQWGVPPWVGAVIIDGEDPVDPHRWEGDRSRAVYAVTCELARREVPPGLIVGILTDRTWGISAHVLDQKDHAGYAWKQVEKAYAAAEAAGSEPGGRRVLDPAAPFKTATRLRAELFPDAIHTNDDWLEYDRGAYRAVEDATMRSTLWATLDAAVVRTETKKGAVTFEPFKVGAGQVNGVLDALKGVGHQPAERMAPPVWLDGHGPPPLEIVALRNGLLHVPTGELLPPSPRFFTRNALDMDFAADAPPPAEWLRFVAEVFPDPAAAELLQDWFGYLLLPETSLQKIMLLVGPTRSGKGVIQHVITALGREAGRHARAGAVRQPHHRRDHPRPDQRLRGGERGRVCRSTPAPGREAHDRSAGGRARGPVRAAGAGRAAGLPPARPADPRRRLADHRLLPALRRAVRRPRRRPRRLLRLHRLPGGPPHGLGGRPVWAGILLAGASAGNRPAGARAGLSAGVPRCRGAGGGALSVGARPGTTDRGWASKELCEGRLPPVVRPCLRCRRPFPSAGPGNRMCDPCRTKLADESPYAV